MKSKNGSIDIGGVLWIKRKSDYIKAMCCRVGNSVCWDNCAAFGEPFQDMSEGMKITKLRICCGVWEFDNFVDNRK